MVRFLNIFYIFTKHRHRDLPIFIERCKYRFNELLVPVAWYKYGHEYLHFSAWLGKNTDTGICHCLWKDRTTGTVIYPHLWQGRNVGTTTYQYLWRGRNMGTGIFQQAYGPSSMWLGGNTGTGIFLMSVARYKYGHRHLPVSVVRQKYGQGIFQCMW